MMQKGREYHEREESRRLQHRVPGLSGS